MVLWISHNCHIRFIKELKLYLRLIGVHMGRSVSYAIFRRWHVEYCLMGERGLKVPWQSLSRVQSLVTNYPFYFYVISFKICFQKRQQFYIRLSGDIKLITYSYSCDTTLNCIAETDMTSPISLEVTILSKNINPHTTLSCAY